jgi:hypothetical protein
VRFRAAAYLPVGVAAWVSAAEGLILLVALLAVDVPTGGRDVRSLATAGVVCVVGLMPMFVTNFFVTGNPAEPPRVLSAGGSGSLSARRGDGGGGSNPGDTGGTHTSTPQPTETTAARGTETGSAQATESTSSTATETARTAAPSESDGSHVPDALGELVDTLVGGFEVLYGLLARGYGTAIADVGRLYPTFVRGGYIQSVARHDAGEAIRLSFLEAMPLAAALVAVPVVVARTDLRGRVAGLLERRRVSALGTVDAFAVVYGVLLTLVYLPRLPVHAAITVRYLLPLFPIALYGLFRVPAVRRVLDGRLRTCGFAYLAGVLVGGQVLVVYLWWIDAARGEAVQAHALVGLGAAALVAGWAVADAGGYRHDRLGAVALGLSGAAGTTFLVMAGLWHFAFVGGRGLPLL